MKAEVFYVSGTGNTARVARAVYEAIPKEGKGSCGAPDAGKAKAADLVFAGFWADKGSCPQEMAEFLKSLSGKKVALFGTAGFGGAPEYFERILGNARAYLPVNCVYLGGWMCQGKMPQSVRTRYQAMWEEKPDDLKIKEMLDNFDRALSHPDADDLAAAADFARRCCAE